MDFNGILSVFNNMTLGEFISSALLVFFIICLVAGLIRGLSRGFKKQGLHTLCTLCAAVFAYAAVSGMTQAFVDSFKVETVADLFTKVGMSSDAAIYLNSAKWLLALPVATVIAPAAFVLFFLFVSVGSFISYGIMKAVLSLPRKERGTANRLGGMFIGVAEAFVCFALIFLPLSGTLGIFDKGVDEIRAKNDDSYSEFLAFYDETIDPVVESFPVQAVKYAGADKMLDSFATVEDRDSGKKINLRKEVISAVSIVTEISTMKDANWKALSSEHQDVLDSVVETLESSEFLSVAVADTLHSLAAAIENGVVPFELEAPFDTLVNSVVSLFSSIDEDSIGDDIGSILSIYYILCDDGVLEVLGSGDSDAIVECLTAQKNGETVINKVIAELKKNEHTKPLVATLTELSVTIMSSQLGVGENSQEVYNNVKDGLKEVLAIKPSDYADTEEGKAQYKEDLTNSLDDKFKENGIELEPEIVGGIADYIDENIEVKEEYTDEEINDIILSYYDVYLEYQQNGTLPDDLPDDFPGDFPSDFPTP